MRGPVRGCCGLRSWTVSICCIYLLIHTGLLLLNLFILNSPESHVDNVVKWIDTNDNRLYRSLVYRRTKKYIIQNSSEYLALPITVNCVLMIANFLAAFGAICLSSLLLIPWLLGYLVYILFASSLLVYMIILLPQIWFKILLFLVVAPIIVVATAFWVVVLRLFLQLKKKGKTVKTMGVAVPATVYTPEPHTWDTPLPIWALQPPTSAWDPSYLQQIDPRYESPEPSRPSSRSRKSSSRESRSRSKSGDSQATFRERQADSMSLSEKYGGDVYDTDRQTDRHSDTDRRSQEPSADDWDTSFRNEEENSEDEGMRDLRAQTDRGRSADEGGSASSETLSERERGREGRDVRKYLDYQNGEFIQEGIANARKEEHSVEVEVVSQTETEDEQEHYKAPQSQRPKSRAESLALSDKYGQSNSSEKYSGLGVQEEIVVNFNRGNYFD